MRETSITVKYEKGHDSTWAVFRGTVEEVREDIVSYFGLDRASVAELTGHELSLQITQIAHGNAAVLSSLGGTPVPASTSTAAVAEGGDPWAQAGVETIGGPGAGAPAGPSPLLAEIEACMSADDLKRLWAENQAAFADEAVMTAWKARGKSLAAAA